MQFKKNISEACFNIKNMNNNSFSSEDLRPAATYKAVTRRQTTNTGKYVAGFFLLIVACFSAGLGGGLVAGQLANSPSTTIEGNSRVDGNAVVGSDEANIASVASKVEASVVSVVTQVQGDSFFGSQVTEGAGTGIILSADGYVITNKHVVADSEEVTVVTSDGTVHNDVRIVGVDPLNDLAYLKIKGVKDLRPANLGDSSSVRIGQNVVAIGNSLGEFQNTVTSGIISGTGRPIAASSGRDNATFESLTDLIQTDAAINQGNSGGPLTNLSGQVIGINTAVAENAQSIGFAIPINSAKGTIKNLLKTGKVERAYLGINYVAITPEIAKKNELPVKKGAWISSLSGSRNSVVSGSPADKAGIKDGDIITKVGDLEVGDRGGVASLVSEYAVGETITITLLRDGKTQSKNIMLEAYRAP